MQHALKPEMTRGRAGQRGARARDDRGGGGRAGESGARARDNTGELGGAQGSAEREPETTRGS